MRIAAYRLQLSGQGLLIVVCFYSTNAACWALLQSMLPWLHDTCTVQHARDHATRAAAPQE